MCGRLRYSLVLLIRDDIDPDGNPVVTPNQIETSVRVNDLHVWIILDCNPDIVSPTSRRCLPCSTFLSRISCRLPVPRDLPRPEPGYQLEPHLAAQGPSLEMVVGAFQDPRGCASPGYALQREVLFIDVQAFLDAAF